MATVTRVLPWRRHTQPPAMEVQEIVEQYRRFHPKLPTESITEAYRVAAGSHKGQLRRSGEPYITHPLAVAGIVARYGMDDVTISAALLHDAVEDTVLTLDEVEAGFGPEVREIVDGVTKLERVHFDSKEAQQAATMRKMLVAMAKDLRVLVIKLADRLHNMRTLAALPAWKQERTAQETLDIYAPLAHRLGMQEVKQQLEDLCFAALHPKRYAEIDHMVANRTPERDRFLVEILDEVTGRLKEVNITAEVTGRPKHLWSIYEKMVVKGKAFDEIFDLVGIRVIVDSSKDCYAALGTIHALWTPVPGRFKDYIAMPKFNLYQSLHTTVIGPGGRPLEVQVRTPEMHHRAEWGVAAHFSYKEGHSEDVAWLTRIVDWQQEMTDPGEFMANLKVDLDQDEVFVFTPQGDVIALPVGATPVDFAYAIHTEVGHRCIGARVGGRLLPLDSPLSSGDTVEIFTSKTEGQGPSRDWLNFVASPRARSKIRAWFTRERREESVEHGKDMLLRELRRRSLPMQRLLNTPDLLSIAAYYRMSDVSALYAAIGESKLDAGVVVDRLIAGRGGSEAAADDTEEETPPPSMRSRSAGDPGVAVAGTDDVLVRLSKCCTPVPGDEIIGFVTRGSGVSVHRKDCVNFPELAQQPDRLVEVTWRPSAESVFLVNIQVEALDRARLLSDVARVLSDNHVNILSASSTTNRDRIAISRFTFEMADPKHLGAVIKGVRTVEGVFDAKRV